MRKLIRLSLLLLALCSTASAQVPFPGPGLVHAQAAGGGCSPATNEVGSRTAGSSSGPLTKGSAWAYRWQADCTGTLETAYTYHHDTNAALLKICVYVSTAATPQETVDTKVGCTAEIATGATTGTKSASIGTGSVTSGNWYWVIIAVSPSSVNDFDVTLDTTQSLYYHDWDAATYATPPAALVGTWSDAGAYAPTSTYVGIQ